MLPNRMEPMMNEGPIITNYSPISSKGGKRKTRKTRRFRNRTKKNKSRRRFF